ncbi:MAG: hypothetical protein ACRDPE_09320 [Solirubrobacterales bacterium]
MTLLKKQSSLAWELRGYLWGAAEIVVSCRRDALVPRYRGYVVSVSPTDATFELDDARWGEPVLIPVDLVLTVRRPHYHEDGPEPERDRPVVRPAIQSYQQMPGQLTLGGEPPPVSKRTRIAMERAAGMLLSQELLDVLAALDAAARGRQSVSSLEVADAAGESLQWTVRRLNALAAQGLALSVRERPYAWIPGE